MCVDDSPALTPSSTLRTPHTQRDKNKQAKKVKEVLSANSNIPVHIEGVHDDIDLSTQVRE